jgi:predicted kinase
MRKKLLILQGIPASGKSTWSRNFIKGKTDWFRVCRDDIRNMRGDYWIQEQERLIETMEDALVAYAMGQDLNVLVDATNLNPKIISKWKTMASNFEYDIEFLMFYISLEEAIERDSKRDRQVGEEVIKRFYNQYIVNK